MDSGGSTLAETLVGTDGVYEFSAVSEGQLRLSVDAQGFRTSTVEGLISRADTGLSQDVRLQVGTSAEQVTVAGSAMTLMTSSATVSNLNNRNLGSGSALGAGAGRTSKTERLTGADGGARPRTLDSGIFAPP